MSPNHPPLAPNQAEAILRFAKRTYRWRKPRVFVIEDRRQTREGIRDCILARFDGGYCETASCIEEAREKLAQMESAIRSAVSSDGVLDLLLSDFKLPDVHENGPAAKDEILAAWLEDLVRCQGVYRCLIFMTAYLGAVVGRPTEREIIQQESMELAGKLYFIEKKGEFVDIILAYLYRVLALEWRDKLLEEMKFFNFDLLSGRIQGPRIRFGELPGMDDFRAFVGRLEEAWPFLAHWPEENSDTKSLLAAFTEVVKTHFHVDDTDFNLETGEGSVRIHPILVDPLPRSKTESP